MSALRTALIFALTALSIGCARYTPRRPRPFTLERSSGSFVPSRCEPAPAREPPTAGTPAPIATGALSVIDVRGDDRLGFVGSSVTAWSVDGAQVFTAMRERVLVWSTTTGALERAISLPTPFEQILSVALSPDGARIAVQGRMRVDDGEETRGVWLLDVSGTAAPQYAQTASQALRFTEDARELFGGTFHWDLASGTQRRDPPVTEPAEWLPDGRQLVAFVSVGEGVEHHYVPELRDARTGAVLHRFGAVRSSSAVAISGDGRRVAVLHDGLSVFDVDTLERVAHLPDAQGAARVSLSHDGTRAALDMFPCVVLLSSTPSEPGCPDAVLSLWDLERGERLWSTTEHAGSSWEFSRDGRFLTGPGTRIVRALLRVENGEVVRFGERIRSLSPDGRWVLFDGTQGLELASLHDGAQPWTRTETPSVRAVSADGAQVVTADADGTLRLERDAACVAIDSVITAHDQLVFSPDGSLLIAIHFGARAMTSYDTHDGTTRWSMRLDGPGSSNARVVAAGNQILVQGYEHDEVHRIDAATGARLADGHVPRLGYHTRTEGGATYLARDVGGDRVMQLSSPAMTRDGSIIADFSSFDHGYWLSVWDLSAPREVVDRRLEGWPSSLVLSPDEQRWAVAYRDGRIVVITRDGLRAVDGAESHRGAVTALAFTPTSDRIVSAGEDGSVLVLDATTGRVMGSAELPLDHAVHLAIAASGEVMLETARGMRVRLRLAP